MSQATHSTVRTLSAALLTLAVLVLGYYLSGQQGGGRTLAFALLMGSVLGITLQRSRFCFYCHARDWFEDRNPRGLLAIILALAIGTVGYTIIVGSWLPVPQPGQLPPDLHIGPVSWVLVVAGLAFGAGMVISGSCISAHWYRLAEGSTASPFALIGTAIGFGLGFLTWNSLYLLAVADAPIIWLPAYLGYGGALALQLVVLAGFAAYLWRGFSQESASTPLKSAAVPTLAEVWRRLWTGRWPYWTGGLIVGLIGALIILRTRPLGVTATLGSATRGWASEQGWIPQRMEGLDGFAGCATLPQSTWLTPNALLMLGLIGGAVIAGLLSAQFAIRRPSGRDVSRGLGGGVLLGWGAMTGLGCSVGNLLSGGMAGAASGWVFGAAMFVAIALGLRIKKRIFQTQMV